MKSTEKKGKNKFTEQEIKIRKRYKIDLLICLIYGVLIELYFISLNAISTSMQRFNIYVKISDMMFIFIAVLMFEIAYKKEKKTFALSGIEFILLAIHTLLIGRNVTTFNENKQLDILTTSYIWPVYYGLKMIIIHTKENKRRLKQISDISEIVKEEKPIKKVAKKRKS